MKILSMILAAALLLSSGNFANDISTAVEQDRIDEISYGQTAQPLWDSALPVVYLSSYHGDWLDVYDWNSEAQAQENFHKEIDSELDRLERCGAGNAWLVPVRLNNDEYFIRWCSVSAVAEGGSPEDSKPQMAVFYKNQPTLITHQQIEDFLQQENIHANWMVICSLGYMKQNYDRGAYFIYAACDDGDKIIPLSLHPDEDFAFEVYTPLEFAQSYLDGDFYKPVVQEPAPQKEQEKPQSTPSAQPEEEPTESAPSQSTQEEEPDPSSPVPLFLAGAAVVVVVLMFLLRDKEKDD